MCCLSIGLESDDIISPTSRYFTVSSNLKMSTWRMAGLNYVNYSNIAARTLRKSLKSNLRDEAAKRDESSIKYFYWVDGTQLPSGEKPKTEKEKT